MKSFANAANDERNFEMKNFINGKGKGGEGDATFRNATNLDMKAYRIEYALNELLGYLGETDVLIGQGLRGELGVSAPAQIQILSSLGDAKKEFDELLRAIPENIL